jgi:hypothetical protein
MENFYRDDRLQVLEGDYEKVSKEALARQDFPESKDVASL